TDRRHIRRKIAKLTEDLEEVRRVRAVQRDRREKNEVPVVAIVGYTNAGKSTLLNALTDAGIPARNRLFDTLDTTTRTLEISDTCTVLISDTVGFIRKLPHHLVEAFKATLEELAYADLILHVIDASNPEWREQADVVESLIRQLGAEQTPRVEVFNKSDVYVGDIRPHGEDIVSISAKTGEGLDQLLAMIGKRLDTGFHRVTLSLPYDKGGVLDMLYRDAKVEKVEYGEAIQVEAVCSEKTAGQVRDFITGGWQPPKEFWED
ncbi:MAG: GTPase HflX, partial [Clostridiales bacterium]|nr:GTPase HflX [Clostridiales bacterium]